MNNVGYKHMDTPSDTIQGWGVAVCTARPGRERDTKKCFMRQRALSRRPSICLTPSVCLSVSPAATGCQELLPEKDARWGGGDGDGEREMSI